MLSPEGGSLIFDYDGFVDYNAAADADFSGPNSGFDWPLQTLNGPSNDGLGTDGIFSDTETAKDTSSKKRGRSESCGPSPKAGREKLRRDRLNDKFMELGSILEPGRTPKTDKAAILTDAVRVVTQLRSEAQKLKDSNSSLVKKIQELKSEKNEHRDEKQKLKARKEKLELQLKTMNTAPGFLPPAPALPASFAIQAPPVGGKLVPMVSYPRVTMWQFMPPAAIDTSQDHMLRPPVA